MPEAEGSRAGPLVGRRQELASLDAALDGLRSPGARWLVVDGEPGTGKTRLLTELGNRAQAREHLVLVGRGSELERDLPFGVWLAALDDHAAALGTDRVEALVGDRAAELARVLPSAGSGDTALGGCRTSASAPTAPSARCSSDWPRGSRWFSSSTTSTGPTRRRSS